MAPNNTNLMAELQALLVEGRKIEAVKRCREATGVGLAEAKAAFVDLTHVIEPGIPHWPGFPDEKRETTRRYGVTSIKETR